MHLCSAEEKPVGIIRSEENEGGGLGLEADELGNEALGSIQFFLQFAQQKPQGPKAAPISEKHLSLWMVHSTWRNFGWDVPVF